MILFLDVNEMIVTILVIEMFKIVLLVTVTLTASFVLKTLIAVLTDLVVFDLTN